MSAKPMPLATCPECSCDTPVKKDGRLRKHSRHDTGHWHAQPCAGSGQLPFVPPSQQEPSDASQSHAPSTGSSAQSPSGGAQ